MINVNRQIMFAPENIILSQVREKRGNYFYTQMTNIMNDTGFFDNITYCVSKYLAIKVIHINKK